MFRLFHIRSLRIYAHMPFSITIEAGQRRACWDQILGDLERAGRPFFLGGYPGRVRSPLRDRCQDLKALDPSLKVGGPALAGRLEFLDQFLSYCRLHQVPLDFVSWHIYTRDAHEVARRGSAGSPNDDTNTDSVMPRASSTNGITDRQTGRSFLLIPEPAASTSTPRRTGSGPLSMQPC